MLYLITLLLPILLGIYVYHIRDQSIKNFKEIYEPILTELDRNKKRIKERPPINYITMIVGWPNVRNVRQKHGFALDKEINTKIDELQANIKKYENKAKNYRTKARDIVLNYFKKANEGNYHVQSNDENLGRERREHIKNWIPHKKWSPLHNVQFLDQNYPSEDQKKTFKELKQKLRNLKPESPEELFNELKDLLFKDEEIKRAIDCRKKLSKDFNNLIDEIRKKKYPKIERWIRK